MEQPPPSRPLPQRWAPPHRSEAGVFGPRGCLANAVYNEEPFPVFPLPRILVWPVPVSETLRRLPEPRQTPRGRGRSSCQQAFTLHLFARCRSVASRMLGGHAGASPRTGVPQGPSLRRGDGAAREPGSAGATGSKAHTEHKDSAASPSGLAGWGLWEANMEIHSIPDFSEAP